MAISTKDFVTLVREQAAAIQGAARSLVDLTVGSILRAVIEANAAVTLWLQGLILHLLKTTRAATSTGADLDSWVEDYGLSRLPAVAATGYVTFSRFTPTQPALIPVGAKVQTANGVQHYAVVKDADHPAWDAEEAGYVLAPNLASITLPVQAEQAGAAGNARIGSIDTLAQAMPGVDTVTNEAALTNGTDAESDPALRKRFIAYIASLSKATMDAVGYAITSVKPGLSYALVENQTYEGDEQRGYFYVVVDDGTGMPTQTLIATVYTAIEAVRPLAVHFSVFAPVVVKVKVQMKIQTAGADHTATAAQVAAAIKNTLNALGLGAMLPYTRLAQIAYDASPAVTNVFAVQLNGATDDLISTPKQTFKAGTVIVT
ncbi:Putative phage protein (baseplate assembly J-like family protein) [Candidatus Glomeribacter gigasporarum BEG34]|uniref:Putative phage protein (Baseplate assembly J-like family protein) n=1 Tax=Candidatus Glomeribacter gigasporarum BEG34 TaxID=1070319 RepID=G2JAZ2_9BURK|nr:baseplate J/gp47 family protein [Candidatus Glomeribacter gigasporarum]CCD29944.1 Putative phage protein (baseplate assembly J-like family protein) [Candidatus Glomeribacter gigasporarum BEG34]